MLYTKLASPISLALLIAAAPKAQNNALSANEVATGYDLLFNGTDLNNWHAYRDTKVNVSTWRVATDGKWGPRIQNFDGSSKPPILTNKKFMNFDLKIDIAVPVNGNSGIFTRYEEIATSPGNARSGPEFQVCGPGSANNECNKATVHFGSCYEMFGVNTALRNTWFKANGPENVPGEWNEVRIVAYDSNYVHYGNGKKLLEYKIGTAEFIQAYNGSKYSSDGNNGRYYHIHPGGFLLQHHGEHGIAFRNIKAKELTVHPFKSDFTDGKWPETLSQSHVFGATTGIPGPLSENPGERIAIRREKAASVMIEIPFALTGFSAFDIHGKTVPSRKVTPGVYSLTQDTGAKGLVFVRCTSEGRPVTKVVSL